MRSAHLFLNQHDEQQQPSGQQRAWGGRRDEEKTRPMVSSQHRNLPGNRWWWHTAPASNQLFTACSLTIVFFSLNMWINSILLLINTLCIRVSVSRLASPPPSLHSPTPFYISPDNMNPIELAECDFPPSLLLHILTKPALLFSINEVINKTSSCFFSRFSLYQRGARGGGEEDREGQESRSSLERQRRRE